MQKEESVTWKIGQKTKKKKERKRVEKAYKIYGAHWKEARFALWDFQKKKERERERKHI